MSGEATTVFVFQQFEKVPVYHLPAWLVDGREGFVQLHDGSEQGKVACGIPYVTWKPAGDEVVRAIRLRWDHAQTIGRMCLDCTRIYYR